MTDDQVRESIARIEEHLATMVKLQMAPVLEKELQDEFRQKLWALTGKAKREEIRKKLKCGPNRIAETWARWEQAGLIVRDGQNYRKLV